MTRYRKDTGEKNKDGSIWGITCGYGVDIIKTNPNVTTGIYCSVPHE